MPQVGPSRHSFVHDGRTIYEWDQSLSEVNLYIRVPEGVGAKQLDVRITRQHLSVGIKGLPPYLDRDLGGAVKADDSFWTLDEGELQIQLTKAEEGATWASAIAGHELRDDEQQADQKRLLLERFQEEHPGFDFSSAEFTGGAVPDPRTFMRDLDRQWQQQGRQLGAGSSRRQRSAVDVAAVSSPERVTVTDRTPPPPPPEVEVKVIGIGSRGASAISKLVQHGKVNNAELWYLDVDKAALDAAPTANTLLLPKVDDLSVAAEGRLAPADLQRIVGRAASDAGGRGNINAGTDGAVTFVLAPAAAAPGGAATVLQIVAALRAAGHFTVAAVTQPFAFEGQAKQEQAGELVAALRQTAHMVAVMEQDVLMQAFGESQMTVAEATQIADNALEHSVRSILQAVQAQEVLKSSRGALMWHGRNLRHFKRILAPPLQQLLTQPGLAVLGRGLASLPAEAAHQMGAQQALMHLASDAVRAAAESPFLDGALASASGVLCCINLPPAGQRFAGGAGGPAPLQGLQTPEAERRAAQMSAQAAAGALGSLAGAACQDFILCAEPKPAGEAQGDGSMVHVEVTLLVLRGGDGQLPPGSAVVRRPVQQFGVGPAVPAPPRQPQQPQKLPSSTWNMLSAMAGGAPAGSKAAAAAAGAVAAPAEDKEAQQPQQQPQRSIPNFFGGGRKQQAEQGGAEEQQQAPSPAAAKGGTATPSAVPAAAAQQQQRVAVQRPGQQGQPAPAAAPAATKQPTEEQRRMTVGDYLVNSLTAQSLDLPPAAAQWRQEHRSDAFKQRKLIVWEVDESEPWEGSGKLCFWEVDESEPWEEEEEPQGLAALLPGRQREKRVNIKQRMASILMQDREDAWEAANSSDD
ncbi:domain-containing 2 [Chlorella sorokiniana]|uniref:Domain-containing 2 n=1 Tax=Chlorella sorokiniana TaxID=3076 RepID=A0A2P6U4W0_CHLSO|nr:domain-containing 2 [Chlorella sorokiniana]|eukprot:PRW61363.1 domain-containing 2 [Chlorella sorokiniana]